MAGSLSVTDLSRRDGHGLSRPGRDSVTSPLRGCHAVTKPGAAGHAVTAEEALVELANRVRRLVPSHRDPEAFHEAKSEIEAELRRLAQKGRPEACAERNLGRDGSSPNPSVTGPVERENWPETARFSPKVPGFREG